MIGRVYLIENQVNGKKYVGKTYLTIEQRWLMHKKDSYRKAYENRPLYNAMRKYGIKNFSISLIEECENIEEREKFWIAYYDTFAMVIMPLLEEMESHILNTQMKKL